MDERRGVPRWQIRKKADVRFEGGGSTGGCLVEDINLKGLCLSLAEQLPQERAVKPGFFNRKIRPKGWLIKLKLC